MKIRKIEKISDEEYMVEYNHSEFGWIPYTTHKKYIEDPNEPIQKEIWDLIHEDSSKAKDNIEIPKARLKENLVTLLNQEVLELESKYTEQERKAWERKRLEAEKVVSGGTSIILEAESKLVNEKVLDLANKIIKKNDDYNIAIINSTTLRDKYLKKIDEVKTRSDFDKLKKEIDKISEK